MEPEGGAASRGRLTSFGPDDVKLLLSLHLRKTDRDCLSRPRVDHDPVEHVTLRVEGAEEVWIRVRSPRSFAAPPAHIGKSFACVRDQSQGQDEYHTVVLTIFDPRGDYLRSRA
jgi:hypothetical protein